MRTFLEWLDEVKAVTGSDYATAKRLGVTRQFVSKMRSGKHFPSNKVCERMADILRVNPIEIIASCEVEKDPAEEKRWAKWLGAAAILSCVVMADSLLESNTYAASLNEHGIHYAK